MFLADTYDHNHIVSGRYMAASMHHMIDSYQFFGYSFEEMTDDLMDMWEQMEHEKNHDKASH